MSEFSVNVIRINAIEPIPNADNIELAVVGDFRSVVKKDQFVAGDLAVYLPESAILPEWLLRSMGFWNAEKNVGTLSGAAGAKIRACRIRQCLSQGILYPVHESCYGPEDCYQRIDTEAGRADVEEGDDVADLLGITKYEPPLPSSMGGGLPPDSLLHLPGVVPTYDIENRKKYPHLIPEGEMVTYTEKVHGSNLSFGYLPGECHPDLFYGGDIYVGSKGYVARGLLFRSWPCNEEVVFVQALRQQMDGDGVALFRQLCDVCFPGQPVHVKAEVYGLGVQDLTYGLAGRSIAAFDVYVGRPGKGRWLDADVKADFLRTAEIDQVPVLYRGPHDLVEMARHRDGRTIAGDGAHIREGIVITPVTERQDNRFGRVILKEVSAAYLLRKGDVTEYA